MDKGEADVTTKRIDAPQGQVSYDPRTHILFAGLGDFDPDMLDHEEEVGDAFVQYAWPSGQPAFVEVWGIDPSFSDFPLVINDGKYEIGIPAPAL